MKSPLRFSLLAPAALLVALFLAGCADNEPPPTATPTPISLTVKQYANESALNLKYPANWTHTTVREGILLFGEENVVYMLEPGVSVVVYRIPADERRGDLDESFAHFMENGPLRTGYSEVTDIEEGSLGGRDALNVIVRRDETEDAPAMKALIVGSQTESYSIYIISATAPEDRWDENWAAFQVMIGSVEFNE